MATSDIERNSLVDAIAETHATMRGCQNLLQHTSDDVTRNFLEDNINTLRDTHSDLETRLQLLGSRDSQNGASQTQTDPEAGPRKRVVYVIHSSEDEAFVDPIMDYLETRKHKVVRPDRDYHAGMTLLANIDRLITKADKIVVVLSPNAFKSTWVEAELAHTRTEQIRRRKQLLIPILLGIRKEDIPSVWKQSHYVDAQNKAYKDKIDALCRRIDKEVVADDIPLLGLTRLGDIATGLTWSYFYGYLRLIIPTFQKRLMESKYWQEEGAVKGNMSTRFVILVPDSCYCHPSLGDSDGRIEALAKDPRSEEGFIKPVYKSRGGTPERPYKQGVYRITMEDGKTYYVVGEYATPLLSMFEMEDEGLTGLKETERLSQKKKFVSLLRDILSQMRIDGSVHVLSYDDTKAPGFKYPIADDLVRVIKEEVIQREADEQTMDTS